jgi:hypothetical protein
MPQSTIPIRAIGRIGRAVGRELVAALRLEADLASQVSPTDAARRHLRRELGRDGAEAGTRYTFFDRVPGWIVLMVAGAIVLAAVLWLD